MDWVALRKESVDRNAMLQVSSSSSRVALRKESVDRNKLVNQIFVHIPVALRKESVDRNINHLHLDALVRKSLSARRAWIEMSIPRCMMSRAESRSPQGERG